MKDPLSTETATTLKLGVSTKAAGSCCGATYADMWHYVTQQLYIFHDNQYARYDVLTNTYQSVNGVSNGYPGVPFCL